MDIYNMSHCKDLTAAIAIMRADKPRGVKRSRITWPGLTYQIGDVVCLVWIDGILVDAGGCDPPNAVGNTTKREGATADSALLPA